MPNKANSHITLAVHTNNEALIYTKKSKKIKLRQTLRLVVGCATESVVSILKYIGLRFGAGILLSVNLCVISQLCFFARLNIEMLQTLAFISRLI